MADINRNEFCAFHYSNQTDGNCAQCGLPICKNDQHYNLNADRICQLCNNITRAKKLIRYIQISIWVVIIGLVILLWRILPQEQFLLAFLPILLMLVTPYILRPLIMRFYFKDLEPKESVLPILRYYEASGNQDHYKLFKKFLDKLSDEEIEHIKTPLFDYLVPALAFNYAKLSDDWEDELVEKLRMTKEDFIHILAKNYRKQIIKTAVHSSQANISLFIIYLSEQADDKELIKDYIKEITSPEVLGSTDVELNTIYNKLLEEVYLYEEEFYKLCDENDLEKEKQLLSQLLARYEPPPVPKNQLEAVLSPAQLKEKRAKEEVQSLVELPQEQEVVEIKEEEVEFIEEEEFQVEEKK